MINSVIFWSQKNLVEVKQINKEPGKSDLEIRDKDETSVLSIKESGLDYFEARSKEIDFTIASNLRIR